ncbi:MAG TPA: FAD-dependent oxidoreductase [Nitrososphaeraceae archaeon]|nr:FAD-dependent oxidoreductase [Nitrososphaeraceae archaeon]
MWTKELYKINPKQVIIAGGGYAGIQAALMLEHLLKGSGTKISLIDKKSYHTLLPSLPEIISKRGFSTIDYRDIIQHKRIQFIQATITNIDLSKKLIDITDQQNNRSSLKYDFLAISLGSQPFLPDIEGLKEYALLFNTIHDAQRIAERISDPSLNGNIVIAGGGATGVELAGEIASVTNIRQQKYNTKSSDVNIILVSPHILSGFPDSAIRWAKAYLESLGVKLLVCSGCHVLHVKLDIIYLANGSHVTYTMFIWTGGVSASSLLKKTGLKIGEKGRVAVNKYLQAEGTQDVFVVGDAALVLNSKGKALPTNAYFAEQHGRIAAQNIHALLEGKEKKLQEYRPEEAGSTFAISIGKDFAVSRVGGLDLFGYSASKLKKLIKMKYLKDISGSPLAWKEFYKF